MKLPNKSSAGRHWNQASSESPLPNSTPKLAPEVRRFDSLQHPLHNLNPRNPGTLMVARNNVREWKRIPCTPGSMLQNVEIRRSKGLLNLTAAGGFATGTLSPTQKRDLQRAVASVVAAYNELAAESGATPVSIHENHLKGDGKVYQDRKIPRISNERDYDYYHTLGVNFAENGRMMLHYHLEFGSALNRQSAGTVLQSLHRIGQEVLGREILSQSDIATVLDNLPEGQPVPGLNAEKIAERRQRLPNELAEPDDRARSRDELESAFIALSSANTEAASEKTFLRNAHMNSFRPAEPMFECFSAGHTSLVDDLERIEQAPSRDHRLSVTELMSIHQGFKKASIELGGYTGGSREEREALAGRLQGGMNKVKRLLAQETAA
ncbi:hypothetical protein [Paraburkholderia sp. CI3]|uniref:hypothetical protein n=1 Tax=Paraburkholderia sp. CI3 TaxID=2991060 RepID=UPI003D19671B